MSDRLPARVLLLETIEDDAQTQLAASVETVLSESPAEQDCMRAALEEGPFHAIITRGKGRVTHALLEACPTVRWVARCGVGVDNIDVPAATERGVGVLNLPGSNAATIAEHTIMLMLAVSRGLVDWANRVRDAHWQQRDSYDRDEVNGKTVGIIGLGNIGRRVAHICRALGMTVVYTDPAGAVSDFEQVSVDDLLARADVVTLHCSLTDATRRLINHEAIGRMKPGAILINTARGPIIDQRALAAAIERGHLGGFGADVLDVQPPEAGDPLLHLPNVIVTPHVGSLTKATYRQMCLRSVENVLGVLSGKAPLDGTLLNGADLSNRHSV